MNNNEKLVCCDVPVVNLPEMYDSNTLNQKEIALINISKIAAQFKLVHDRDYINTAVTNETWEHIYDGFIGLIMAEIEVIKANVIPS